MNASTLDPIFGTASERLHIPFPALQKCDVLYGVQDIYDDFKISI